MVPRVHDDTRWQTFVPVAADFTTTYWVTASGADTAPGSIDAPWRTLQHAVDAATPGARILIGSGTYTGFRMTTSGGPGTPTVIAAGPGANVAVTAPLASGDVIDLVAVHDVAVRGITVRGARGNWRAGILVRDGATRVEISDDVVTDNADYGVRIIDATNVEVTRDDISHNGAGVIVERAGSGVHIHANIVHDNDRMIVNDAAPGNDTGAMGIVFQFATGPVTADHNVIFANRAQSHDFGYDGSGFEIFGAAHVTMASNVLYDNEAVLETGTDGPDCVGNRFEGNVAWGPGHATVDVQVPQSNGVLLRCATSMVVEHNTLYDLDGFAVWFDASNAAMGGVAGLRVSDNLLVQPSSPVYELDSSLPNTVTVDANDVVGRGAMLARIVGQDAPTNLAELQHALGFDMHGVSIEPVFAYQAGYDLRAMSPAVRGRYGAT